VEAADLTIRNATYRLFRERGAAPALTDVAVELDLPLPEVRASWRRLHDAHAIVLASGRDELRMANPFSAVPTAYRVQADGRWWDANCAWDAFGICAALGVDGRIETTCGDCEERIVVGVRTGAPTDTSLLFHCLVPAARWWDDIGFT
jgi:Alkylmercury lyase